MRKTHIGTGLLLIPVCLWCLFWLIPNNTEPASSELDLPPALMPSIAAGICLLMAAILLVRALRAGKARAEAMDEEFGEDATGIDRTVLLNLLAWSLLATGAWLVMAYVGFEPAMTLVMVIVMLYVGARNPVTIGLASLLAPVVLSQSAWHFFSTEMPGFWR